MNLVTDGLPALALGTSSSDPDVMQRKPRKRNEKILNRQSMRFIVIIGIIMAASTLYIFSLFSDYTKAITMAFTTLIILQMVVALIARSERYSIIKHGFKANKKLFCAIVISIFLQLLIIYIPFFNTIFSTVPIGIADWGIILLISAVVFVVLEVVKVTKKGIF
jgi:Ca2+-transporting ATPase